MGYEILDTEGTAGPPRSARGPAPGSPPPSEGPAGPPDVVQLESLPEPAQQPPGAGTPWWPRAAPARGPGRRARTLIAVVAVVGLVLGVGIDRHHTAQVRVAEARHRLEAVAVVQSLSPRVTGRGLIVDLDVQLYNAGPRPIDVEVTPDDPPPAGVRVEVLTGSRTVPSGGAQAVTVRVPVDCSSSLATEAALAVRTADGTQHRLPLRSGSGASFDQTDQQGLCQMLPDRQQLNAQLAGSLTEPVLALTNNTDGALMVSIDSASPMTQVSSHRLSFTTVPALPLKLAAHSSRTVRISVGVPGCIIGDDLPALSGIGYLGLRGDDARGVQLTAAGVDVGALVGGAIARTCH